MLVNVLKPFAYSTDTRGIEILNATPGERDIPTDMLPGLIAEGFVEQPEDFPLVPMAPQRRKVIVDRLVELFRAHMEALSNEQLTATLDEAERQTALAAAAKAAQEADGSEAKDQSDLFNGADPAAFDHDTADEDALRAFLTTRDGKEPDKRFGVDRLRALAKTAPAAEGASE